MRTRVNMMVEATVALGTYLGFESFIMSTSHLAAHAHGLVPEVAIEQPVGSNLVDAVGTLDFGSLSPSSGTVEKTFTIRNTGAVDLSLGSITKDGANSSDFAITAPSLTTLAPGRARPSRSPSRPPPRVLEVRRFTLRPTMRTRNRSASLAGRRLTYQEAWRQQYFNKIANGGLDADANDFEKDGLSNFLEFAIGGDPKVFTPQPGTLQRVGNTLEFIYQRSKGALADGYAFRVEFRGDLTIGDWNSNGVTEEVLSENAQLQQVKVSWSRR